MVTDQEWIEISELLNSGMSVPEIAHRTGRSTTTLYRLKTFGGPKKVNINKSKIPKRLLKYQTFLEKRIRDGVTNAVKLFLELQSYGYKGPYYLVNKFARQFLAAKLFPIPKQSIRFETSPGEQAQVDWGEVDKIEIDDQKYKLFCFVYTLCYSRIKYVEFTIRQNLQTLEECHIHAFEQLGIPKTIVYDNMKTVVLDREKVANKKEDIIYLHPGFLDFARFYGFDIKPHSPYWPRSKGKIERGVGYVKNHFMQGMKFQRDFNSLEDLNEKVTMWLKNVANAKIHNTTREIPFKRWKVEKPYLEFPNNIHKFNTAPLATRKCTSNGTITYKNCWYAVPIEFACKTLMIRENNKGGVVNLDMYHKGRLVITHSLSPVPFTYIPMKDKRYSMELIRKYKKIKYLKKIKINNISTETRTRPLSYYNQLIPN